MTKDEKLYATWCVELNVECPQCNVYVDLLEASNFWEEHDFKIGESETERTKDIKVYCPACAHDFKVTLEY